MLEINTKDMNDALSFVKFIKLHRFTFYITIKTEMRKLILRFRKLRVILPGNSKR